MIPPEAVEAARAARVEDALALIGYRLPGKRLQGPCPVCGGRDRFYVARRQNVCRCRKCMDRHLDAIGVLVSIGGKSFREAVELLSGRRPAPSDPWGDWR